MGKKGSWFSAIKRVFTHGSKEKLVNEAEKKSAKEKKKGRGILKHGEIKSFLPLFREPSSIEKILGEADKQKLLIGPPTPSEQPNASLFHARPASPRVTSPRVVSPRVASPRIASPRGASPRVASPPPPPPPKVVRRKPEISYRPEPTLRYRNLSATKIQAAYRGYMARRSFKALKGLVRLQGVVRGQNVKRQTANAMKQMQLLVRVQTQIQSRRIQMLESQHQTYKNDKEVESSLGKWTVNQLSEAGDNGHWDDSLITKEEREARLQRKMEAVIKRERAMAYAYSNQLWKANPKSAQAALTDIRSGGFPWWWNWLERQLPAADASDGRPVKNFRFTPPRLTPQHKPSPRPQTSSGYKPNHFGFDHLEPASTTPRSSKSTLPARTRTPFTPSRTPPSAVTTPNLMKYSKPRGSHASASGSTVYDMPLKDDDSLVSCPPFSVPNYMAPTVSAKAKVRPTSNPKERFPGTPGSESSRRRFSFPLTPNMGSFKWNNKGSSKDSVTSEGMVIEKHKSPRSIGEFSVDSTISMPVGRKPFNRFV